MQTMHPSIMLGSYIWLQDRLPIDEFRLRLDDIFEEMDKHGWKGLLVYGDAREHAALAYVSNFIPRMRWGMALIARDGNHRLLCSMSTRDLPAMRTMTWIGDVHSGWEWDKTFDPWLQQFKSNTEPELATVGLDLMAPVLKTSLDRSIGDRYRLTRADETLTLPLPRKRPREISMIRASCRVVEAAAKAFIEGWRASGAPETGALQGERAARAMAAQDVRTLVSLNGGRTLVPFQGKFDKVPGPLLGYIAVKLAGYWADMLVTAEEAATDAGRRCDTVLDQMIAAARPGTRMSQLHSIATRGLQPLALHPVLSGSVGNGIGLSLHERPSFRDNENATLADGGVYALQVGGADPPVGYALTSAIVHVRGAGPEILTRSPVSVSGCR
jgi:Xaa-Pro aminopeptidase